MKRYLLLWVGCLCVLSPLRALTKQDRMATPHELRVGWGDFMFESAMWHTSAHTCNYRYTGHLFAEYQYYFTYWFSFGGQVDYDQVWWTSGDYRLPNSNLVSPEQEKECYFYNITFLPTVRFTYYSKPYVNLYLALGLGLTVNAGTEMDMYCRTTAFSPALNVTLLGVRVGGKHVFGTFELGALNAVRDKNLMYMLGARLLSLSVGASF